MSWNNDGDGGWKSGSNNGGPWGQSPWGQGPRGGGGGQQQPDLEEILKRSQDKLKRVMPGSGGTGIPSAVWLLIAVIGIGIVGFYAFTFKVNPNQRGIVLRFGEYVRWEGPGLHFRLPYPVEEVMTPDITKRREVQIGMTTPLGGVSRGNIRDVEQESLMLTGDENIVDVDFVVVWYINNAEDYLFNIQHPDTTVKEVAESSMREVVGQSDIQPILTQAREKTEAAVMALMQVTLDQYKAGIKIDKVRLQKVDPPTKVIDSFRDVQAARADQERLQNEAKAYANQVVPKARGEAERSLQAAEAYRQQTIAEAKGQAARFEKIYEEYRKAPDVTRKRLFLETMERVLSKTDKIILDSKAGSGVVPYLPLNEMTRKSSGGQ